MFRKFTAIMFVATMPFLMSGCCVVAIEAIEEILVPSANACW